MCYAPSLQYYRILYLSMYFPLLTDYIFICFPVTIYFSWWKIAIQCVGFCCTVTWICLIIYTYPPLLEPAFMPLVPLLWVITKHRARLLALFSNFPLSVCFTHGVVYLSVILSQFIPPSPFPTVRFPQVHSLPGSSVPLF